MLATDAQNRGRKCNCLGCVRPALGHRKCAVLSPRNKHKDFLYIEFLGHLCEQDVLGIDGFVGYSNLLIMSLSGFKIKSQRIVYLKKCPCSKKTLHLS